MIFWIFWLSAFHFCLFHFIPWQLVQFTFSFFVLRFTFYFSWNLKQSNFQESLISSMFLFFIKEWEKYEMFFSGLFWFRFGFQPKMWYQKPHFYMMMEILMLFFPIRIQLGFHFNVISYFSLFDIGWFFWIGFCYFFSTYFCIFYEITSNFQHTHTQKRKSKKSNHKFIIYS